MRHPFRAIEPFKGFSECPDKPFEGLAVGRDVLREQSYIAGAESGYSSLLPDRLIAACAKALLKGACPILDRGCGWCERECNRRSRIVFEAAQQKRLG